MLKRHAILSAYLVTFAILLSTPAKQAFGKEANWAAPDNGHEIKELVAKRYNAMLRKTVRRAKAAETSSQQRLILSRKLRAIMRGIERAQKAPFLSEQDRVALNKYLLKVRVKHDRLNGLNGVAPVPTAELDNFSDSIQQDLQTGDVLTILAYIGIFVLGILLAVLLAFAPLLLA